jgi:predicted GIY-YIG superfamily endonuclease
MTVYLIHFDKPYRHARHYLGSASRLKQRLARHRAGQGARLLDVIQQAGITWRCVRQWKGGQELERRLKRRHSGCRLCPICLAAARQGN